MFTIQIDIEEEKKNNIIEVAKFYKEIPKKKNPKFISAKDSYETKEPEFINEFTDEEWVTEVFKLLFANIEYRKRALDAHLALKVAVTIDKDLYSK